MQVKVRQYHETEALPFCSIASHEEVNGLIEFIKRSGGINHDEFNFYQLSMDAAGAYVEIVVGDE